MFRRLLSISVACLALFLFTALSASAQTGALRGKVVLKQADGTQVPADGAAIVVYRTDVSGEYKTKTGKNGEFAFAGLPFIGTYVITVSRPGAQPTWIPGVKAGRETEYVIDMSPGDGRVFTPEEVKQVIAQGKGPAARGGEVRESAEDKAKRAELEKKNAEIAEKNKKAEASNAIIQRTFKAGNDFLKAKDYDQAIAQFNEGLQADPEHPGAPSLMTNKAAALRARAVQKYNAAIQAPDETAKKEGVEAAKKDWREAYQMSSKAVEILKGTVATAPADTAPNAKTNLYFAHLINAETAGFFVTKVDPTQAPAGITAYEEYIAIETDPVKKAAGQKGLAQMLFDAGDFDKALTYYQKILAVNPDDLDALLRSGQALFNIGAINNDKAKYQEAADYLAKFVDKAPDGNTFKTDAQAILETLKAQENVKPTTPARRRRP
jgi:tetratricopeptide (TPR) repeat protein